MLIKNFKLTVPINKVFLINIVEIENKRFFKINQHVSEDKMKNLDKIFHYLKFK